MKKTVILSVLLFASICGKAQSPEVNNTFVYALPKTVLFIEIETEKVTQTPGMFYQYSERYLATQDVITELKIFHTLKSIRVRAEALPDPDRTYSLSWNDKKAAVYNVSVDEKGIICGINTGSESAGREEKEIPPLAVNPQKETATGLLPMGEDYMFVSSVSKLAEGAAKQIYRIRENRLNILAGDIENYPADGNLYISLMEDMNKKEKELTEL
ncbi:MAG: DUF4831 family protein, partial [Prevotellaceae bacterium]|nr:DUF4831 family protein [Prevotellaceae bacterium]